MTELVWFLGGAFYLALALLLAVTIGRGITIADRRQQPTGPETQPVPIPTEWTA